MSQALHIFRKDLRRGWPLLFLWAALLGLWLMQNLADPLQADLSVERVGLTLPIVVAALIGVSLVVHEEPLVGTTAFWMTRPIEPLALFLAKAGFLVLFIAAPLIGCQMLVLGRFGAPHEMVIPALIEAGMPWLFYVPAAFGFASITRNTPAFVVAVLATLVSLAVLGLLAASAERPYVHPETELWGEMTMAVPTVIVGLAAIVHQYLTRRTALTVLIAVIAWVLKFPLPDDYGPRMQARLEGEASIPSARVELVPGAGDGAFTAFRQGSSRRTPVGIWAMPSAPSVPAGHDIELVGLAGEIEWDEHEPTQFVAQQSWFADEGIVASAGVLDWFAGRGAIPAARSLELRGPGSFEDYLPRTGSVAAESPARLWRLEPVYLSLEAGARASGKGWAALMVGLQRESGNVRVVVRVRRFNGAFWPSRLPRLLLVNRTRGEMIAAPGDPWARAVLRLGELPGGPSVQLDQATLGFPMKLTRPGGELATVDERWLAEAELLLLHYAPAGRLWAEVELPRLALEEQREHSRAAVNTR